MLGQIVRLKNRQCYQGCIGAVVEELPKDHHPSVLVGVYIDGLGTIIRCVQDLEVITEEQLESGDIQFVSPQQWLLETNIKADTAMMMAAIKLGKMDTAEQCAERIVEAERMLKDAA